MGPIIPHLQLSVQRCPHPLPTYRKPLKIMNFSFRVVFIPNLHDFTNILILALILLFSPAFIFQATMSSGNLISGLFTFAAQAMATNLACCSDFQSWTGISNDFSATGFAFSDLFGSVAVFEFVTVMIYFFLQNKGCGDALPTWFFKTMLVTSVFWMNKDAIFTPARIWTGEMNFATVFGTYRIKREIFLVYCVNFETKRLFLPFFHLNNFAAVFFGVNLSHYAFKQ